MRFSCFTKPSTSRLNRVESVMSAYGFTPPQIRRCLSDIKDSVHRPPCLHAEKMYLEPQRNPKPKTQNPKPHALHERVGYDSFVAGYTPANSRVLDPQVRMRAP